MIFSYSNPKTLTGFADDGGLVAHSQFAVANGAMVWTMDVGFDVGHEAEHDVALTELR